MAQAKDLAILLGERVRSYRVQHGWRQEDLAQLARSYGLETWRRSTVATVEAGRREMSIAELVLLAKLFNRPLAWWFEYDQFGEAGRSATVRLTPAAAAPLRGLHALFSGATPALEPGHAPEQRQRQRGLAIEDWEIPERDRVRAMRERWSEAHARAKQLWPRATKADAMDALVAAGQDAEMKAARKLGLDTFDVAVLAACRWGRSLTEQRDERVKERSDASTAASAMRALRGHVTRELLAELRQEKETRGL